MQKEKRWEKNRYQPFRWEYKTQNALMKWQFILWSSGERAQVTRSDTSKRERDWKFGEVWVFEEVEDVGQETVGSRWVITRKEKADGQKKNYKGWLVGKGFQENEAPQSDSPTMLREPMKMFFQ